MPMMGSMPLHFSKNALAAAAVLVSLPACYDSSSRRVVVVSPITHLSCLGRASQILAKADYSEVRDIAVAPEKGVIRAFFVNRSDGMAAGWGIEVATVQRGPRCEYRLVGLTGDQCVPANALNPPAPIYRAGTLNPADPPNPADPVSPINPSSPLSPLAPLNPPNCYWSEARRPDLDARLSRLERALELEIPEDTQR